MRHLILIVAACLSGCGLLNGGETPNGTPVTWPDVVECGPDVPDLVSTVSRVLLDGSGLDIDADDRGTLEDLAAEHGPKTILCLVDLLVNREWSRPGASQSPKRLQAVSRGRDFINETGARVVRVEGAEQ